MNVTQEPREIELPNAPRRVEGDHIQAGEGYGEDEQREREAEGGEEVQ